MGKWILIGLGVIVICIAISFIVGVLVKLQSWIER